MSEKYSGCPGAALWAENIRMCSECGCIHHDNLHGDNWYCDALNQAPGYDFQRKTYRPKFCPMPLHVDSQPGV
jgi:hypothetical protein